MELLLNGTNGVPPSESTSSKLALLKYALSAGTSLTVKFSAVVLMSVPNYGQSLAFFSVTTAAVTTLVFTPQTRWHLTHSAFIRLIRYFSSNHLT
jgi:hypothetical protein